MPLPRTQLAVSATGGASLVSAMRKVFSATHRLRRKTIKTFVPAGTRATVSSFAALRMPIPLRVKTVRGCLPERTGSLFFLIFLQKRQKKFQKILQMTKRQNILLQLKTYDLISLPSGRKERSPMQNEKLRNVAIIAHVDHGKTTPRRRNAQAGRRVPRKSGGRRPRYGLERPRA